MKLIVMKFSPVSCDKRLKKTVPSHTQISSSARRSHRLSVRPTLTGNTEFHTIQDDSSVCLDRHVFT
jgi:hypothetical protein